jgi:hypothetical protein
MGTPAALSPYHSCVGAAAGALSQHIQRLIGYMRNSNLPSGLDCEIEVDIIIATDGSVLFGVGYHSWLVATKDEDILMAGGGPDDGLQEQMTSYRSKLARISAGLGILGNLTRSGLILISAVTLICQVNKI